MREYGLLMVYYDKPELVQEIQNMIPYDELYSEDGNDEYGIENDTHVTLVSCLPIDLDINEVKSELNDLSEYKIVLTNISKFDNEKFEVLKCDVVSTQLCNTNNKICNKFPTYSEYKEYKPHLTIAYMKKGMADKYMTNSFSSPIVLKPKHFMWSYIDEDVNNINITFV